jgi:hypothetical protein
MAHPKRPEVGTVYEDLFTGKFVTVIETHERGKDTYTTVNAVDDSFDDKTRHCKDLAQL